MYEALKNYSYQICNCTSHKVKVECNDTEKFGTVYYIKLIGPMSSDILQTWLQNEENNFIEVDFVNNMHNITVSTLAPTETISDYNKTETSISFIPHVLAGIIIIILSITLIVAFIAIISFCLHRYCNTAHTQTNTHKNK